MTYWKKFIGSKSLDAKSVLQHYLPELFSIIPLNIYGNPGDGEESHPTAKNLLISPTRKKPINKFTSLVILIIFI